VGLREFKGSVRVPRFF